MKKLISKFSDRLLNNQQLKVIKGGNQYCNCGGTPVYTGSTLPPEGCVEFCRNYGSNPGGGCPSVLPGCPPSGVFPN